MQFGCNYWASHAGTEMWRQWDENVIREDMRKLHEAGNEILRVFPVWRDFQPIELARRNSSIPCEILMHNHHLPTTYCGQNGVDEVMVERFRTLIRCAESFGMKLIVSLITGWMSGRQYVPPAIENRDVFTDPLALKWQIKFVRTMVHELKNEPAIIMWELGNECNNLHSVADSDTAYTWTHMIISAIKMEDPTRPAGSGMHGLGAVNTFEHDENCRWTIQDQGEICDFLTPHPYPFSCSKLAAQVDVHTSFRMVNNAALETQLYSDIGKRPAFVEETNVFSSAYCNDHTRGLFMRNSMFNAWAHGSDYFLWWCAFDQDELGFPPFEWSLWERENGEFNKDGSLREAVKSAKEFSAFQKSLPFKKLSPCRRDAVCLLTRNMGKTQFLNNAWSCFLMAKMAGFNVSFDHLHYDIPESDVYIMPGVCSLSPYSYCEFLELYSRVEKGATLYMSVGENGVPTGGERFLGCTFISREKRTGLAEFTFRGQRFAVASPKKFFIRELDCEVLAREDDGNPVFIHKRYGKGHIYFLTVAIEDHLAMTPHAFDRDAPDSSVIYKEFCRDIVARRIARSFDPFLTLTEHSDENGRRWIIAVNNSDAPVEAKFDISPDWKVISDLPSAIGEHNGIVFEVARKDGDTVSPR